MGNRYDWIELLEVIGDKDGLEIYSALLHRDGIVHSGYAVVTNDGGTWIEENPLAWPTLEECFQRYGGGIDATTVQSEESKIFEAIVAVSQSNTDFELGFDCLFGFMANNPNTSTTANFIEYHVAEMNSPVTDREQPDFTYLIGKNFIIEHWVANDDRPAFQTYVEKRI